MLSHQMSNLGNIGVMSCLAKEVCAHLSALVHEYLIKKQFMTMI